MYGILNGCSCAFGSTIPGTPSSHDWVISLRRSWNASWWALWHPTPYANMEDSGSVLYNISQKKKKKTWYKPEQFQNKHLTFFLEFLDYLDEFPLSSCTGHAIGEDHQIPSFNLDHKSHVVSWRWYVNFMFIICRWNNIQRFVVKWRLESFIWTSKAFVFKYGPSHWIMVKLWT